MTGAYFATGPCCFCDAIFTFDPELVPSIPVDERGAIAVDDAGAFKPTTFKRPICEQCMTKINRLREQHEMPAIAVLDGAYAPAEGFPP